jgi:hypothetical protein
MLYTSDNDLNNDFLNQRESKVMNNRGKLIIQYGENEDKFTNEKKV